MSGFLFALRRCFKGGSALAVAQGSEPIDSDRIERNLGILYQRAEPQAISLYARVLASLHEQLSGQRAAEGLAGAHAPSHWREQLRGQRSMSLLDFCRLVTEQTREARLAVRAGLSVLLDEISARPFPASERAAAIALSEHAQAVARVLMEQGVLDQGSRDLLLPLALRVRQDADDLVAALQAGVRQ